MKHESSTRRQGGFTLVEIAIVLMIVGLLIGGILRGQELIQSARVRNIIDQKSAIQTAYIGFLDRYRMLPGDLTGTATTGQAGVVGNGAVASVAGGAGTGANVPGDGVIALGRESILFFQNLTAAGFISCGGCMTVTAPGAPTINNSPINVYGNFLAVGNEASNTATSLIEWFHPGAVTRLVLSTGAGIPSQVLAEVDRKADDGLPSSGQLRFAAGSGATLALCATGLANSVAGLAVPWAIPSQANCQGAWLF
jgi:prepilin-type N-terminal cleavage/methylation domain-containing protein